MSWLDTIREWSAVTAAAAPAKEKPEAGVIGGVLPTWETGQGATGLASYVDVHDPVPELNHPESLDTYREMTLSPVLRSLLLSTRLPIMGWTYFVNPGNAAESTTARVAANFGLPIHADGEIPGDRAGIDFHEHLDKALDSRLQDGHAYFEIIVSERVGGEFDGAFWIDELQQRPPRTISGIKVAQDGSLEHIYQYGFGAFGSTTGIETIPAAKLLAYVNEPQPGDWYGAPIFRPLYESWYLRKLAVRLAAVKDETNARGVPKAVRTIDRPTTPDENAAVDDILARFNAGEGAGLRMPYGWDMELMGTTGTTSSPIDTARYHDEKLVNGFMSMVQSLGQTQTGSRALGDTFEGMWMLFLQSVVKGVLTEFNALIRRYVDWTEGPDAPAPTICFDNADDPEWTLKDLAYAVESKMLQVDDGLRKAIRSRAGLPPVDPATVVEDTPVTPPKTSPPVGASAPPADVLANGKTIPPGEPVANVSAAAGGTFRPVTEIEAAAGLDPGKLDKPWQAAKAKLIADLQGPRAAAAAELVAQVKAAMGSKDPTAALAAITAGSVGEAQFIRAAQAMVHQGAGQATSEAASQGVSVEGVTLDGALETAATRGQRAAAALGTRLAASATSRALAGAPDRDAQAVADDVAAHLDSLSDADLASRAQATLSGAMGDGRTAVQAEAIDQFEGVATVYSSAILDTNVCGPCSDNDGHDYESVADADEDYPDGSHYVDCEGSDQCRCLTIVVYADEST